MAENLKSHTQSAVSILKSKSATGQRNHINQFDSDKEITEINGKFMTSAGIEKKICNAKRIRLTDMKFSQVINFLSMYSMPNLVEIQLNKVHVSEGLTLSDEEKRFMAQKLKHIQYLAMYKCNYTLPEHD